MNASRCRPARVLVFALPLLVCMMGCPAEEKSLNAPSPAQRSPKSPAVGGSAVVIALWPLRVPGAVLNRFELDPSAGGEGGALQAPRYERSERCSHATNVYSSGYTYFVSEDTVGDVVAFYAAGLPTATDVSEEAAGYWRARLDGDPECLAGRIDADTAQSVVDGTTWLVDREADALVVISPALEGDGTVIEIGPAGEFPDGNGWREAAETASGAGS